MVTVTDKLGGCDRKSIGCSICKPFGTNGHDPPVGVGGGSPGSLQIVRILTDSGRVGWDGKGRLPRRGSARRMRACSLPRSGENFEMRPKKQRFSFVKIIISTCEILNFRACGAPVSAVLLAVYSNSANQAWSISVRESGGGAWLLAIP